MENKKTLSYIAAACFILVPVIEVNNYYRLAGSPLFYGIHRFFYFLLHESFSLSSLWGLLLLVGGILIAVSLFTSKQFLMTAGCAASTVAQVCLVIRGLLRTIEIFRVFVYWVFSPVLVLAVFALLLIASIKSSAVELKIAAAACAAVRVLLPIIGLIPKNSLYSSNYFLHYDKKHFFKYAIGEGVLSYMLLAVGILLIALPALMHHAGAKASPAKAAVPAGGGLSQTERLIKLKSLLDSGVITQEEFDTKKKDIMG